MENGKLSNDGEDKKPNRKEIKINTNNNNNEHLLANNLENEGNVNSINNDEDELSINLINSN